MRGRYWLPLSTQTRSLKPCPPSQSKHFPLNQAILRNLPNLTMSDKNDDVYPAASGENVERSCPLFILSPHNQIHFCFSQVLAHLGKFLLDCNAPWKEVWELEVELESYRVIQPFGLSFLLCEVMSSMPVVQGTMRVKLDRICKTPSTVPGTWQVLKELLWLWLLVLTIIRRNWVAVANPTVSVSHQAAPF